MWFFGGIFARKIQVSNFASFHQIEFLDKIGLLSREMRLFLKIFKHSDVLKEEVLVMMIMMWENELMLT